MKIGLLGGTFDPPHYGHLIAAQEAAWQLGLARVLFLPARQNPLKQSEPVSAAEHRVGMVERAIQGNPLFQLSRADLDRPPPSYTVDLLHLLRTECPEAELFFLGGADLLLELPSWHAPEEVLRLACFVAVPRPGWPAPDVSTVTHRFPAAEGRVLTLRIPGVDVSSTDLRERAASGRPLRYLMPDSVADYIQARGLYRRMDVSEP